jgi:hypothetical protein
VNSEWEEKGAGSEKRTEAPKDFLSTDVLIMDRSGRLAQLVLGIMSGKQFDD